MITDSPPRVNRETPACANYAFRAIISPHASPGGATWKAAILAMGWERLLPGGTLERDGMAFPNGIP